MRTESQPPQSPPPPPGEQPAPATRQPGDSLHAAAGMLPAVEGGTPPPDMGLAPTGTTGEPTVIPPGPTPGPTTGMMPSAGGGGAGPPGDAPPKARGFAGLSRIIDWRIVAALLVAGLAFGIWRGVTTRAKAEGKPITATPATPVPAAKVTRQDLYNEVPLPAEFRPYLEVELHAKVSGYLKQINVDFGDHVKAGQLLATLEVPELRDELHNAIATWEKAEADYTNAHLIYQRLAAVNKDHPNLVAQQDLDTAEAKDRTTFAAIAAAKADMEKYQTLCAYTKITAPFDGVITKRYADPGALIQAGTASDTQSMPLVRVSDNYLLRLDFPVDLPYVKDVHEGDKVDVSVESLGGKTFTGTITRSTLKVEENTRTMITEIEVPNPNLEIVPGMYCRVVLRVQRRPNTLAIPIQAVPPGYGQTVDVITPDGRAEERQVKLGLETPTHYEVLSGLQAGEVVLLGSRSQIQAGEKVEPKLVETPAQQ